MSDFEMGRVIASLEHRLANLETAFGTLQERQPTSEIKRHTKLYVGKTAGVNDGVVTTNIKHLSGETDEIGWSIHEHPDALTELFVGVEANVNEGVVTTNSRHLKGATEFIGYTAIERHHGTLLWKGTSQGVNEGVVSTHSGHLKGESDRIGFTVPEAPREHLC